MLDAPNSLTIKKHVVKIGTIPSGFHLERASQEKTKVNDLFLRAFEGAKYR